MILGSLNYSERIEALHPRFKEVFDYIKQNDLLNAPLERITLDGDKLFINNVLIEQGKSQAEQPMEAHKRYIDIHVLLQGEERVGWADIDKLGEPSKAYDEADDYMLYEQEAISYVDLKEGEFVIVYPEDAHAPIIGKGQIRKLIVKVLID